MEWTTDSHSSHSSFFGSEQMESLFEGDEDRSGPEQKSNGQQKPSPSAASGQQQQQDQSVEAKGSKGKGVGKRSVEMANGNIVGQNAGTKSQAKGDKDKKQSQTEVINFFLSQPSPAMAQQQLSAGEISERLLIWMQDRLYNDLLKQFRWDFQWVNEVGTYLFIVKQLFISRASS